MSAPSVRLWKADLRAHGVEHLHVVARRVAVARGRGRQVVAGLGRRAHALVEAARRAVGEERVGLAARALDRGAPGGATAVVVGLVVGRHGRADLARVADVAVGVGEPVVAVAVGVVAGGVLGEVADARDPVAALGGRALERLVLDQLARVVVLLARGHGVAAARGVRGLLVVHHVVVPDEDGQVVELEHRALPLERFEELVGVDDVLLRGVGRVDVEEDPRRWRGRRRRGRRRRRRRGRWRRGRGRGRRRRRRGRRRRGRTWRRRRRWWRRRRRRRRGAGRWWRRRRGRGRRRGRRRRGANGCEAIDLARHDAADGHRVAAGRGQHLAARVERVEQDAVGEGRVLARLRRKGARVRLCV